MNERVKRMIRAVIPPQVLAPVINRFFRVRWTGQYDLWELAARHSRGYDEISILDRVATATRLVRDGQVAFERDGRVFKKPEPNWRLLAVLRCAMRGQELTVVDFGGALGSSYWQNRPWLKTPRTLRWRVVEQPHFVSIGNREFANDELGFCASLDEAVKAGGCDVLLLAGVLSYLPAPHDLLAALARHSFAHVFIDRTGVTDRLTDRLTVQHVPPGLGAASYPCWFFNEDRLLRHFSTDYEVLDAYTNEDGDGRSFVFKGFHLQRRKNVQLPS